MTGALCVRCDDDDGAKERVARTSNMIFSHTPTTYCIVVWTRNPMFFVSVKVRAMMRIIDSSY
jgi:hypothetical protein